MHGSSPAQFVCRGAQRGISLAAGTFTGESKRTPPAARFWKKRLIIKGLRNHDLGALDSFAESRESSLWKPPRRKPASGIQLARHLQNSGLTRDGEAFAPRRSGTSLSVGCDATSAAHTACGAHPGPAASSAPDWRWVAKANAAVDSRRPFEALRRLDVA